jgi:hypothetical protein
MTCSMHRLRGAPLALLVATILCVSAPAYGEAPERARAAKIFRSAEAAFRQHDYRRAAEGFEEANAIAPHPSALFNAARAWEKAGELVVAANLCARYLRDAPADDARRSKANALIADLIPKLGRIEVIDKGAKDVAIDGRPRELEVTYVDPGDHTVTGVFGDRIARRKLHVIAGSLARVALERPKSAAAAPVEEPEGSELPAAEPRELRPLSPAHVWVGAGLTAALAGLTVWSGLDTVSAREQYDEKPTPEGLDEGRGKQRRTNVLLGATLVVAISTGVAAAWLTEWRPPEAADLSMRIGPSWLAIEGSF